MYLLGQTERNYRAENMAFDTCVEIGIHVTCCAGKEKKMNEHLKTLGKSSQPGKSLASENKWTTALIKWCNNYKHMSNAMIAEINVGHLHLDREIKTYYNIQIKLQKISWEKKLQYLIINEKLLLFK